MQFTWNDHIICLQGVSDNTLQEVSLKQLQRLQATNLISEYYHLHMSTSHFYHSKSIPTSISPLLDKYEFLFHDPSIDLQQDPLIIKFIN